MHAMPFCFRWWISNPNSRSDHLAPLSPCKKGLLKKKTRPKPTLGRCETSENFPRSGRLTSCSGFKRGFASTGSASPPPAAASAPVLPEPLARLSQEEKAAAAMQAAIQLSEHRTTRNKHHALQWPVWEASLHRLAASCCRILLHCDRVREAVLLTGAIDNVQRG